MIKLRQIIKKIAKPALDRINNEQVRENILRAIPFWSASLIVGILAVLYARSFAFAEKLLIKVLHHHDWLIFLITPLCFILSWLLVVWLAPNAKGSGIPQVMAALELAVPQKTGRVKKLLSLRILVVKYIASIIMAFGGGVIGREGPTVQIAASVFRKIYEILPPWWPKISKKNMIMTGAAAGMAATFNTPLGGIVFAIEELTKTHISYFRTAIFTAVILAGLTAQGLAGSYLYIGFPVVDDLSKYVLPNIVLVALVAGLMGGIIAKIMLAVFAWKKSFKARSEHIFYLLFCSLTIAGLAYFVNSSILGSGKDQLIRLLFTDEKYTNWYNPLLRMVGQILSFTTGSAGGVFAPALSTGGSIGSVISHGLNLTASDTNLMILAGMVAFLTGITRAPFTSAILVLEMTDRSNLVLHLMLAGIVSNLVAMLIDRHSFYDRLKVQCIQDIRIEEQNEQAIKGANEL